MVWCGRGWCGKVWCGTKIQFQAQFTKVSFRLIKISLTKKHISCLCWLSGFQSSSLHLLPQIAALVSLLSSWIPSVLIPSSTRLDSWFRHPWLNQVFSVPVPRWTDGRLPLPPSTTKIRDRLCRVPFLESCQINSLARLISPRVLTAEVYPFTPCFLD